MTRTIPFKSAARGEIEAKGYHIVVNIGDQYSVLAGGYAERVFKLPDPFYYIPQTSRRHETPDLSVAAH